jgi:hypothetical protein
VRARARFRVASALVSAASNDDPTVEIARVAREHAPDGGYGETSFRADTGTVCWVPADWTSNEEVEAAHAAFLDIDGVNEVVGEAEQALPNGENWQQIFPEPGSEEAYERVLALAMRPLDLPVETPTRESGVVADGRLRLAERALDTVDGVLRLAQGNEEATT